MGGKASSRQNVIKTFISAEYAKENKQNKLTTATQFKANAINKQVEATEELIAALTEAHTKQMETLIKSTTDTMKEMMLLIKDNKSPNNSSTKQTDEEKKKKRDEKSKKYNDAPICKHCGKKHPTKAEDDCWDWKRIKTHPRRTGSPRRAPEGVRGPKYLRRGNQVWLKVK
jgi:hypothetical protein